MTARLTERITVRFTPEAMEQLHGMARQLGTIEDPESGNTRTALASDIVRWAVDEVVKGRYTEPLFSEPIGGHA